MLVPVVLLAQVFLPDAFKLLPRPGLTPSNGAEIAAWCQMQPDLPVTELLKREHLESDSIPWRDASPQTRVNLVCSRALLSAQGAIGREGVGMNAGDNWAHGALNILLQDLKVRPADPQLVDLLALIMMRERFSAKRKEVVAPLRIAVDSGLQSRVLLRACSHTANRLRDSALLTKCSRSALAAGIDSTWHLLQLVRNARGEVLNRQSAPLVLR